MSTGQAILFIAAGWAFLCFLAFLGFLLPKDAALPMLALSLVFGWSGTALK